MTEGLLDFTTKRLHLSLPIFFVWLKINEEIILLYSKHSQERGAEHWQKVKPKFHIPVKFFSYVSFLYYECDTFQPINQLYMQLVNYIYISFNTPASLTPACSKRCSTVPMWRYIYSYFRLSRSPKS